jgi:opacity protein-like surface antigen
MNYTIAALALASLLAPGLALAQSGGPTTNPQVQARQPRQVEQISSIERGLYIEAKATGGYTVSDQKISQEAAVNSAFPGAAGTSEQLGGTAGLQLNVGYDLTNNIAVQAVLGELFASGRRSDVVRDIAVGYGGLQGRVAIDLTERLDVLFSGGVAFASQSNQVEKAQTGAAVLGGVGIEYYVHVRHFSVGLELSALAPLSPTRVFVGLSPMIKYTF